MTIRAIAAFVACAATAVLAAALVPVGVASAQEPARSVPVMLVLDASGSMNEATTGGTRIAVAKRAVNALVDSAPDGSRLGLTVYGTGQSGSTTDKADGCRDVTVVRPVGDLDRQALKSAAESIRPQGWTPVGPALRKAAAALPQEGPRSIVLVSDGEDTCAPPEPCEVARELAAQGLDLRVHTVGFAADAKTRDQLMCVARETGGTYADAPDAGTLERELARVTSRALRNYEPSGTSVAGAPDPVRAPMLQAGGYLDQITDQEVKHYAVDVPAGYTAYVSGTVINKVEGLEAIDVRHVGERTACESDTGLAQVRSKVVTATVDWAAAAAGTSDACERPGRQVFSIGRRGVGPPVPLEVQVILEPAVRDAGPAEGAVAPYTEPGGAPQPVTGGSSFASATTLPASGHYTDTVATGEWVFYRVRLEWGQSLAFQTRVGGGRESVAVQTQLYNPVREELAQESAAVTDKERLFSGGSDPFATRPVRYLNRNGTGAEEASDMLPGWYYIAVAAQNEKAQEVRTLAVDVSVGGAREPGPGYADDAQVVEAAPSQSPPRSGPPKESGPAVPPPATGGDEAASSDDSSGFGGPIVWTAGSLAVLLGAAVTTWRLRRRGTGQAGPPSSDV